MSDNKAVSAQPAASTTTEAEKIWKEIKNKEIMMFSLPNQQISNYCAPVPIEPNRCFLLFTAGSVLPAVEEAVGPNYVCEVVGKYIVVARKPVGF